MLNDLKISSKVIVIEPMQRWVELFELVQQCLHAPVVWGLLRRELFFFSLDMLRLEYLQAQELWAGTQSTDKNMPTVLGG